MELLPLIFLSVLGALLLVQLVYFLLVFTKFAWGSKQSRTTQEEQPVSVIIAARNEVLNLKKNLPMILEQDYPDYEVVVINDSSWDGTAKLLEVFQEKYPRLKVVTHMEQERYPKGKKFALTLGIKAAKNELLLFTDADCIPESRQWVRLMTRHFTPGKDLVLGFSPYRRREGFLGYLIGFETFFSALQYLSWAMLGKAYMGVGRNLAYRKSLFFFVKGFASHNHLASGDDDLFVNETATNRNVAVEAHPDSFVITEPKETFASWMKQKIRHMSTGRLYNSGDKWRLGTYSATHLLFYLALAAGFGIPGVPPWAMAIAYGVRLMAQYAVFAPAAGKLRSNYILVLLPLLDLTYLCFHYIIGIRAMFYKNKIWS